MYRCKKKIDAIQTGLPLDHFFFFQIFKIFLQICISIIQLVNGIFALRCNKTREENLIKKILPPLVRSWHAQEKKKCFDVLATMK